MPIFYRDPNFHPSTEAEGNHVHGDDVRTQQSPPMRFRRSLSPEVGSTTLKGEDGRPLSRGEIIERLKSSRNSNGSLGKDGKISPRISQESFIADPKPEQLPSPELEEASPRRNSDQNYSAGMDIERPRSALHSGDFRQERDPAADANDINSPFSTSPPDQARQDLYSIFARPQPFQQRPRSRSGHHPPLPNFQFLAPTSPLIHASSNPDLERQRSPSPAARRHTISPPTLKPSARLPAYQAHQPQRAAISIPQTPPRPQRPRGLSISSSTAEAAAASPLHHHAPLVGSYEESILRGRMSTTPSRPLDFLAQVGVLARGACPPSLRCPAHVAATFPAVFYSYPSHSAARSPVENSPSPYVGLVNIEQSFPAYTGAKKAAAPPGGCYRIPPQGQLQIIIKNPNKTAVKLFLVPYDVRDMPPHTKTFIRQRCYSAAGPIIDMPLSSRTNLGTDRPEAALSSAEDPTDRPVLRYLVHLHMCSPAKGRFFLYRSIRVVFANRVPDGKERLRCEVQLPEPRYTPYKPSSAGNESASSPQRGGQAAAQGLLEKAARRRSTPFSFGSLNLDAVDGLSRMPPPPPPLPPAPLETLVSRPVSREQMAVDAAAVVSPAMQTASHNDPSVQQEQQQQQQQRWQDSDAMEVETGTGNNGELRSRASLEKWLAQRWHPSESPRDV